MDVEEDLPTTTRTEEVQPPSERVTETAPIQILEDNEDDMAVVSDNLDSDDAVDSDDADSSELDSNDKSGDLQAEKKRKLVDQSEDKETKKKKKPKLVGAPNLGSEMQLRE